MPKPYEEPVEEEVVDEPEDAGVSEEYITKAGAALGNLIPEDFQPATVSVPVAAEDGEEVAVLLTGVASGGKLSKASVAVLDLADEKPESKPKRLKKMFGGDDESEEMR